MTDITPLSADALATLVEDFEASDHNRMAMNAVTAAGINKVARNYDRARLMQRRFSTIVDDGKQTIVFAVEHIADFLTGLQHQIAHLVGEWNFLQKISGSRNRVQLSNIDIHGLRKHGVIQQLRILRTIWTAKT